MAASDPTGPAATPPTCPPPGDDRTTPPAAAGQSSHRSRCRSIPDHTLRLSARRPAAQRSGRQHGRQTGRVPRLTSLEVRRIDRRADSTTAPRYLPSLKLGPELGVKGRRFALLRELTSARAAATVVAGGCHQLITPSPRFNRLLAPCPRRAQTAGDSRPIAGSSGWPRPAQSSGPPRWIARIKLVPKLTVRVRFPSPAPNAKSVAIHTNWTPFSIWIGACRRQKSALVPLRVPLAILASAPGDCQPPQLPSHNSGSCCPRPTGCDRRAVEWGSRSSVDWLSEEGVVTPRV